MIRVLALIAFIGFIVSVACFAGAAAIGGRDIAEHGWSFPADWHIDIDDDGDHDSDHDRDWDDGADGSGPSTTREIPWNGATSLDLDVPADVRFTQGPGPAKLVITGPKGSVDHVVLEDGRLSFDEPMHRTSRLTIVMTAPNVSRFVLNGDDRLTVSGFKQDRLAIDISGSAEAVAQGEAKDFDVQISGSGEADLSKLAADAGKVDIAGSGRASIAPRTTADVAISGSGEVTLLTKPQNLHSNVTGSGRLVQGAAPTT
jgi:hypothetical protein